MKDAYKSQSPSQLQRQYSSTSNKRVFSLFLNILQYVSISDFTKICFREQYINSIHLIASLLLRNCFRLECFSGLFCLASFQSTPNRTKSFPQVRKHVVFFHSSFSCPEFSRKCQEDVRSRPRRLKEMNIANVW